MGRGSIKHVSKNVDRIVHFIPLRNEYEKNRLHLSVENVLSHRAFRLLNMFKPNEIVGIKPCVNDDRHTVEYIVNISAVLRKCGVTPFVCDTSDRYINNETNGVKHCTSALLRESRYRDMALPYVMLDGISSNHEISAKTHDVIPQGVYLAGELPDMQGLISVCCSKPSLLAGLSGSIVNVGVGLASKRGKILQHAMSHPKVHIEKCYTCRKCLRVCPAKAIYVDGHHVAIDAKRCINCGLCTEVAVFGGVRYDWDATPEHFQKAVVRHALAASGILHKRIVYINILHGESDSGLNQNGILISLNPVAIDAAAADIGRDSGCLNEHEYQQACSLIDIGQQCGLGSKDYMLDALAY